MSIVQAQFGDDVLAQIAEVDVFDEARVAREDVFTDCGIMFFVADNVADRGETAADGMRGIGDAGAHRI